MYKIHIANTNISAIWEKYVYFMCYEEKLSRLKKQACVCTNNQVEISQLIRDNIYNPLNTLKFQELIFMYRSSYVKRNSFTANWR